VFADHCAYKVVLDVNGYDAEFAYGVPEPFAVALNVVNLGSTIIDVLGEDGPDATAWWQLIGFFIEMLFPPQH